MTEKLKAIQAAESRIAGAIGRPVDLTTSTMFGQWAKLQLRDVPNTLYHLPLDHLTVDQAIERLCAWRP